MNLNFASAFIANYTNLLFVLAQIIVILFSFVFYKKNKKIISSILVLIVNFSLLIYLIIHYNYTYNFTKFLYYPSAPIPLPNILKGIENMVLFLIVECIINLFGAILIINIIKKNK